MPRFFARTLCVARTKVRSFRRNEDGSVLAYMVVLPVLAGALAIGVETGELYRVKRQMQSAADAAALAGTIDSLNGAASSVVADARYEAQRNGFANGAGTVNVAVNVPPTSGPNVATSNAVEVVITKTQNLTFGSVLNSWMGRTSNGYALTARSVAARTTSTSSQTTTTTQTTNSTIGCLVALTPNNERGIMISSFNNYTGDCAIMSNGTATGSGDSASISLSNFNNFTLSSSSGQIWTRGSFTTASYNNISIPQGQTKTNQSTTLYDPYASLATPSPGTCTYTNYVEPSGSNLTMLPGTYCGGLTVSNKSNVYFTAGTYHIANGDLVIRSDNNVSCSNCTNGAGVTFVLTQTTSNNTDIGGVSITSENNVTLNAPNSGTYKGVLFYQDRRVAAGTMNSTAKIFTLSSLNNATLSGAIYFPNNAINISSINNVGGNSTTGCTVWIGLYLKFSSYNNNYVAGCATYGTTPAGVTTTTTTTSQNTVTTNKGKVLE